MSDAEFERRIIAALRAPVAERADARSLIMQRVRAAARAGGPRRSVPPRSAPSARQSMVGLALAASIGSIAMLGGLAPRSERSGAERSGVIGDSVVATLRDTLRLVRLIFDDPEARRVAVVGDFNGWTPSATPLHRDAATRRWSAVIALHDGDHRYAFVVDGARWVPDPSVIPVRDGDRLVSLLHVVRASN
jgi:hypothetical protein